MFCHSIVVLLWITLQTVAAGPNCPGGGGGGDSTPAVAGRSGGGDEYNACPKIMVCHNGHTIEVCENALPGLLNAGATEGPCPDCEGITHTPIGECTEQCFDCNTCPEGYNDGCNECYCDENGLIGCTERACLGLDVNGLVQGEPYCLPGCRLARPCLIPECGEGEILATRGGECCPECIVEEPNCDEACCNPLLEPGQNGNPICFEGHACCPDGTWSCSIGDAKTFPCGGELITDGFGTVCRGN